MRKMAKGATYMYIYNINIRQIESVQHRFLKGLGVNDSMESISHML